ncbi:MAG: hypothetical protein HQ464_12505 [Planctomycetes bacterium]|nr:hypothetical protein [Planctomycetota bacterium]
MWKSVFLATGIFACVAGLELLLIDSAVLLPVDGRGDPSMFTAPDWAPWSLISAGAVTILHFCSLPTGLGKSSAGPATAEPRFR